MKSGIIFTDGASSGNPGPSGWAAIVVKRDGSVQELGGRVPTATNNQMELTSVIQALIYLQADRKNSSLLFQIYTDSSYVIQGITKWVPGWKKRNWITASGSPVANIDLWEQLSELASVHTLSWHLVKGHSGVPGNERADQIAVDFSLNRRPGLYSGSIQDYSVRILDIPEEKTPSESKAQSKPSKNAKPYSYLSLVNKVPMRHPDWKSCEARVKGQSGALFKKAMTPEAELEILRSWGFEKL